MSPRPPRLPRLVPLAVMLLALVGCGTDETKFAPVCPKLSLLQDASDLLRFAGPPGAPHDARSMLLAAHIVAVPAHCGLAGTDEVRAVLNLVAEVRRGPAATGDTATIPYFVAITQNGHVLDELNYTLSAKFRPNVATMTVKGGDVDFTLPVSRTVSAAAYHLYVGFRLSPAELGYNRQAAPH